MVPGAVLRSRGTLYTLRRRQPTYRYSRVSRYWERGANVRRDRLPFRVMFRDTPRHSVGTVRESTTRMFPFTHSESEECQYLANERSASSRILIGSYGVKLSKNLYGSRLAVTVASSVVRASGRVCDPLVRTDVSERLSLLHSGLSRAVRC